MTRRLNSDHAGWYTAPSVTPNLLASMATSAAFESHHHLQTSMLYAVRHAHIMRQPPLNASI